MRVQIVVDISGSDILLNKIQGMDEKKNQIMTYCMVKAISHALSIVPDDKIILNNIEIRFLDEEPSQMVQDKDD